MQFQSFVFIGFFGVFFFVYLIFNKHYKLQNILLLIASYIFYGYWDWRFLFLLLISTVIDFWVGFNLYKSKNLSKRKLFLSLSIFANLSILGFFKYFNFFADSAVDVLNLMGFSADLVTLNIVLPVGISFYTFQTLSYTIDIYRGMLKPTKSIIDFAVYVAFFPQLVAGPIERAVNLLPQITSPRKIVLAQVDAAIFLLLWGYFKKLVIADNVAAIANPVFNDYTQFQGLVILAGILAFTVQIYCDFSAYSDIARGLAKLMGFELMINFKLPFFALNPSDFWSRWHISLSTWLKDYLYIPLGGNRYGNFNTYRNLFLTMLLGGLWHGAAWNFVLWGAYQGGILIIYRLCDRHLEHLALGRGKYSWYRILSKMLLMFILTNIGWVIFRSSSIEQIVYLLTNWWGFAGDNSLIWFQLIFFTAPLFLVQLWQYFSGDLLAIAKTFLPLKIGFYTFFLLGIIVYGARETTEFIYFQF